MRKYALVLIVIATIIIGCKGGSAIVGKWNASVPNGPTTNIEFTDSEIIVTAPNPQTNITARLTGSYKIEGNALTVNITDITLDAPAQLKSVAEAQLAANKAKILEQVNKSNKGNIEWKGADSFVVKGDKGIEQTFTRIKS